MGESDGWVSLLKESTVRLSQGTGFVVAPGLLATCAHVVPEAEGVPGVDLAFVSAPDEAGAPALLSPELAIGDELWTYGYPATARAGQPATFVFQGVSGTTLLRGYGVPVGPGYSGSPVVNRRTGAVCGMLATSDLSGSAHLVPAADIVAHCPVELDENRTWLSTLTDKQLAAGGWLFAGPHLRAYLRAAMAAADSHPYVGATDERRPSLSKVYVSKIYMERSTGQRGRSTGRRGRRLASDVLDMKRDVLLTGVSGAGKSSLLRMAVTELARRWLAGTAGDVPVRVSASDLLRPAPFAAQLGEAVHGSLGGHLLNPLPPGFFGEPPMAGARWLILVDGLDEVDDREDRRSVVDLLRRHRSKQYRFVVATRPLSEGERSDLGMRGYELQPFETAQLLDCAQHWCESARLPDPRASASDYLAQIERAGMREPARLPLMAGLTCQLYLNSRTGGLPTRRHDVYEQFVYLMRTHEPDYEVFDLLPRLAWARREGATEPAVDLILQWMGGERADGTPGRIRARIVREGLRASGLMYETAHDFVFLHQSFQEFLSARHITANVALADAYLRDLDVRNAGAIFPFPIKPFDHFLIASLNGVPEVRPRLVARLRTLATRRFLFGVQFIAELVKEGTIDDPGVVEAAASTAARIAAQPSRGFMNRMNAAWLLYELGDAHGADFMAALADGDEPDHRLRDHAAQLLEKMDDPRGRNLRAEVAVAMALDPELDWRPRTRSADLLGQLGDPRHVEVLKALLADDSLDTHGGAHALAELDLEHLVEVAGDPAFGDWRAEAARRIARERPAQGHDLLMAIATDPATSFDEACSAVSAIVELNDPRCRTDLLEAARNQALSRAKRAIITVLGQDSPLSEEEDYELGLELISDPASDMKTRVEIAGLYDNERLASMLTDPTLDVLSRFCAFEALTEKGAFRELSSVQFGAVLGQLLKVGVEPGAYPRLAQNFQRVTGMKPWVLRLMLFAVRLRRSP
jgi:HEAT repeat protein